MNKLTCFAFALALSGFVAGAAAEDKEPLKAKLKVGDGVGAYSAVKVGGAEDGVKIGKALCYL
jgi:hypothetical protein